MANATIDATRMQLTEAVVVTEEVNGGKNKAPAALRDLSTPHMLPQFRNGVLKLKDAFRLCDGEQQESIQKGSLGA